MTSLKLLKKTNKLFITMSSVIILLFNLLEIFFREYRIELNHVTQLSFHFSHIATWNNVRSFCILSSSVMTSSIHEVGKKLWMHPECCKCPQFNAFLFLYKADYNFLALNKCMLCLLSNLNNVHFFVTIIFHKPFESLKKKGIKGISGVTLLYHNRIFVALCAKTAISTDVVSNRYFVFLVKQYWQ